MTDRVLAATQYTFKRFHLPQFMLLRFVSMQTVRSAAIWGVVFGGVAASSAIAFVALYTTPLSRAVLAATIGNNAGLQVLLGQPYQISTVGGFTAWRTLGIIVIISTIWMLLLATKTFRGEEETGRLEMFLTGQTTARRAAVNNLVGLWAGLLTVYLLVTIIVAAAGQTHGLHISLGDSAFFGLAVIASAVEFLSVAALMSQLAPTRKRAAMLTASVFGVSFVMRAIADVDHSLRWLSNITPLGWIEKLHPLTDPNPIWLVPVIVFSAIFSGLAIYLAGKRDLGASILADKDTARPHIRLLNSPLGLAIREERVIVLSWIVGASCLGFFYGLVAKTAAEAFSSTEVIAKTIGTLTGQSKTLGVETFLGVVFLLLMVIMMVQVAGLVSAIREDEARGYLDNLLVRSVSRLQWLSGRLLIVIVSVVIAGLLGGFFAWVGAISQHADASLGKMFVASINAMPAALFTLGVGVFVFGFWPRLTSTAMYIVVAWSFLMEMIGSAIQLNHYVLDTSLLHHVALAPAVNPNWRTAGILAGTGLILIVAGALAFHTRDLAAE